MNFAGVAQSVEQLIRNQQVAGSSPATSSKQLLFLRSCFVFLLCLYLRLYLLSCKAVVFRFPFCNGGFVVYAGHKVRKQSAF